MYVKVSHMNSVVQFGRKGKLSHYDVGPYEILEQILKVEYRLDLPSEYL